MRFTRRFATAAAALWRFVPPAQAVGLGAVSISQVEILASGDVLLHLETPPPNPSGCTPATNTVVITRLNADASENINYDNMLTAALMARATGQRLGGWLVGCAPHGTSDYPHAIALVWKS